MKRVTGLRLDVAPEERFATAEKTWAVFVDALRAGDRATVLACFSPRMRYRLEPGFRSMSNEKMKDLGASELGAGTAMGDVFREYAATVGPERLAGNVTFVKMLGAWRIEGM